MIPYSVVAMQEDPSDEFKAWWWAGEDAMSAYRNSCRPKDHWISQDLANRILRVWQPPKLEGGK